MARKRIYDGRMPGISSSDALERASALEHSPAAAPQDLSVHELGWVMTSRPDRAGIRLILVALMLVGANAILRVSLIAGVIALGATLVVAVGFVAIRKGTANPGTIPSESWLFASIALVPTIPFTLITIGPIQDWVFPAILVLPAGLGAFWILINLPDWRVAGLSLPTWSGFAWSLVAVPFVGALAVSGLGESDMYFGTSDGAKGIGRILVFAFVAFTVLILFYGLIQGPAESSIGRSTIPWIALVFASTFFASWTSLVFLLMFGLVLGAMRLRFDSIWPGFVATVLVFMGLMTL